MLRHIEFVSRNERRILLDTDCFSNSDVNKVEVENPNKRCGTRIIASKGSICRGATIDSLINS